MDTGDRGRRPSWIGNSEALSRAVTGLCYQPVTIQHIYIIGQNLVTRAMLGGLASTYIINLSHYIILCSLRYI